MRSQLLLLVQLALISLVAADGSKFAFCNMLTAACILPGTANNAVETGMENLKAAASGV